MKPPVVAFNAGSTYSLTRALLLYTSNQGNSGRGGENAFVTLHSVRRNPDGTATIGAGTEVTQGFLRRLCEELSPRKTGDERKLRWMDGSVLALSAERMIWHRPCSRRCISFKSPDEQVTKISGLECMHPHLVFHAGGSLGFRVFAVAKATLRPEPETPLYYAPYWNTYSDGSLCWGGVDVPAKVCSENIPAWEDAFFNSPFTHCNYRDVAFHNHPKGFAALWRDAALIKGVFPSSLLRKSPWRLKDLMAERIN